MCVSKQEILVEVKGGVGGGGFTFGIDYAKPATVIRVGIVL